MLSICIFASRTTNRRDGKRITIVSYAVLLKATTKIWTSIDCLIRVEGEWLSLEGFAFGKSKGEGRLMTRNEVIRLMGGYRKIKGRPLWVSFLVIL